MSTLSSSLFLVKFISVLLFSISQHLTYFFFSCGHDVLVLGSISIMVVGVSTFISVFLVGKTSRKGITRISLIIYILGTIVLLLSSNTIWLCIGLVIKSSVVSKWFFKYECFIYLLLALIQRRVWYRKDSFLIFDIN